MQLMSQSSPVVDMILKTLANLKGRFEFTQVECHALHSTVRFVDSNRDFVVSADRRDHRLYVYCTAPAPGEGAEHWYENLADLDRPMRTLEVVAQELLSPLEARRVCRLAGKWINPDSPEDVRDILLSLNSYLPLLMA